MSNKLRDEVYSRQTGSMARTAVLSLMADRADNDGTGIWSSKQRMADDLGTTKPTIIAVIKSLIADGLVREVGQRRCTNGYLIEYAIEVARLESLPLTKAAQNREREITGKAALPVKPEYPTGKAALPDQESSFTPPVKQLYPNPPLTLQEPSVTSCAPKRAKRKASAKVLMAEDWQPDTLPDDLAKLVAQWPSGRLQRVLSEFRRHWIAQGTRRPGWDRTWQGWVERVHDRIMRDSRGPWQRNQASVPSADTGGDGFISRLERAEAERRRAAGQCH